ncbi:MULTISPECIES: DUF4397 domain-containing protein [Burkholderiaceae]|uniref:DUF4397 domain-containing protein n=1 Tax=Burkholderiaceae TaxID=119060 RepID=UPI000959D033|nr:MULTISPECIES: DUF4397 domain-containing protein [Burkholderiaceae]MCG1038232.1 DUF4397 domain-containing protein [Mycetohabitans sp. B7]SIT76894.1 protein of unknown function [Burkholderia sp. b14]
MKSIRTVATLTLATLMLGACGGGGKDLGTELGLSSPQARFINAVPIGPNLDYYLNGQANATDVQYKGVTRYRDVGAGTQTATYNATGTSLTLASQAFNAAKGRHYTTIAIQGSPSAVSVIDDPYDKGLLSDKARVRGFNASFNAPNVDIYVVAPGTDISSVTPTVSSIAYQHAVPESGQDSVYLSGGTYQVIVTHAGTKTPILTSAPVSLANNADWLILTIPSGGIGDIVPGNIHVLVAQGNEADTSAQELTPQ